VDFVELHLYLAFAVAVAVVLVALEGAVRALLNRAPGRFSGAVHALAIVAIMITMGGGLGLLVRGAHPREFLHFIYAAFVLVTIPFADALTSKASPRMRGLATMLGALVALVLIWRLFSTG
jgi:hypothetical protein